MEPDSVDISVIFATRNRKEILRRVLLAFGELDCQGLSWEIIVADNGSGDGTLEVLEEFSVKLPLRYFSEAIPGKNRCLNQAVLLARGDLYIFTDDDVLPRSDWLKAYKRASALYPECKVWGGRIDPDFPVDTPDWIRNLDSNVRNFAFSEFVLEQATGPSPRSPNGPNMAIDSDLFKEFKFNESVGPAGGHYAMGSETELLRRLAVAGYLPSYVEDSCVKHIVRQEQVNLKWLAGRAYRLGRGQMAGAIQQQRLGKILCKTVVQMFYVFPVFCCLVWAGESKRFWSVWHWEKAKGRLGELWANGRGKIS